MNTDEDCERTTSSNWSRVWNPQKKLCQTTGFIARFYAQHFVSSTSLLFLSVTTTRNNSTESLETALLVLASTYKKKWLEQQPEITIDHRTEKSQFCYHRFINSTFITTIFSTATQGGHMPLLMLLINTVRERINRKKKTNRWSRCRFWRLSRAFSMKRVYK